MTDQRNAVRRGYDEVAETYLDERSPDPEEIELLGKFSDRLPVDGVVLDAGCGAGDPVAATLTTDFGVVGMDISSRQLELAAGLVPGARLLQGDLTTLPFGADAFDGIVAFHSLIHVPTERHAGVYEEFGRVVRPGGHLLVTVGPDAWEGTNPDWLDAGGEMQWSFPDLEVSLGHLGDAGFEVRDHVNVGDELGGSWEYVLARRRDASR